LILISEVQGYVRERVQTDRAPKAIGPYSQAIKANGMLFASGQVPIDPATGEILEGTIGEQTERVLKNLQAVLEAAGTSLDRPSFSPI
jgi:2-iminobutanoate/2-iminopropanoate deaminase